MVNEVLLTSSTHDTQNIQNFYAETFYSWTIFQRSIPILQITTLTCPKCCLGTRLYIPFCQSTHIVCLNGNSSCYFNLSLLGPGAYTIPGNTSKNYPLFQLESTVRPKKHCSKWNDQGDNCVLFIWSLQLMAVSLASESCETGLQSGV